MGHCIHVIVAPTSTADSISEQWPELPRLDRANGFAIFPIDADLIDARIAPDKTPTETGDEFMLLTNGFRVQLRKLSLGGQLAYVETEYFGGNGGQGALVCRDGDDHAARMARIGYNQRCTKTDRIETWNVYRPVHGSRIC